MRKLLFIFLFPGFLFGQALNDSVVKKLKTSSGIEKADIFLKISYQLYTTSPDLGLQYADSARLLSKDIGYRKGYVKSYIYTATNYWGKGKIDTAQYYYYKSALLANLNAFKRLTASAYNGIGNTYYYQNLHTKALEYYLLSLGISEKNDFHKLVGSLTNNIATIYDVLEKKEKALEYFLRSLKYDLYENNTNNIVISYNNIGSFYNEGEEYEKSEEYHKKALELSKKTGNTVGIADSYLNLGALAVDRKNYSGALNHLHNALRLYEEINDLVGMSSTNVKIAECYYKQEKYYAALPYAESGYELSREANLFGSEVEIVEMLAEIQSKLGNYRRAFNYLSTAHELSDSIKYADQIRSSTELEMQYKFDKERREKELEKLRMEAAQREKLGKEVFLRNIFIAVSVIALFIIGVVAVFYRQKKKSSEIINRQKEKMEMLNDELRSKNLQLTELNNTRNKFFSIIGHDLRSPFISLIGSSDILLDDFDTLSNEEKVNFIEKISLSSRRLLSLLENLLEWSRVQTGKIKLATVEFDFRDLIKETVYILQDYAVNKGIEINTETGGSLIVEADRDMLNTVLRNLISNAVKFTDKGGVITIKAFRDNSLITCSVSDTGRGIASDELDDLFRLDVNTTSEGTDHEKGTGLGLILCREFIEMHGGTIEAKSSVNQGTTFTFRIPGKHHSK